MAGNLGTAVIEFSADTAQFIGDVGKASATFNRSMAQMERGIGNLRNAFIAVGSMAGIGAMIKSAIDAGDQLNKLSQKIGMSVERLSSLKYAAELSDLSLDTFAKGMRHFNEALVQSHDATSKQAELFRLLGVDATRGPSAALKDLATAFSKLEDSEVKTAVATTFFGGKIGMEFIPLLNQGGQAIDETAERVRRMGLVMGPDFAKHAEQFNDNMKMLKFNSEAIGVAIASVTLPALVTFTENLTKSADASSRLSALMKETGKVGIAMWGDILGGPFDLAAQGIFKLLEPGREIKRPGIQPIRPFGGELTGPPAPNPEALACVVSGGKWINGKCVREKKSAADDSEHIAQLQLAAEEEFQKAVTEGWNLTAEVRNREIERDRETRTRNLQAWFDMIDAEQESAVEMGRLYIEGVKQTTDEMTEFWKQAARNMESAMSSFFFDVMQGNLSDLSASFKRTIDQMVANMLAAKAATALFGAEFGKGGDIGGLVGSAIGSIFGGGGVGAGESPDARMAAGGPVMRGATYLIGERGPELFTPASSGNITPNHALGGMVNNFYITTPDADSFNRSRGQIAANISIAVAAARRNL